MLLHLVVSLLADLLYDLRLELAKILVGKTPEFNLVSEYTLNISRLANIFFHCEPSK